MTTLKGLGPTATAAQRGHNPVGVVKHRPPLPRVARPAQPWALLRNPFGILSRNFCRVPGIIRHPPGWLWFPEGDQRFARRFAEAVFDFGDDFLGPADFAFVVLGAVDSCIVSRLFSICLSLSVLARSKA